MSLGLNNSKPLQPFTTPKGAVHLAMITTESAIPGFEIAKSHGPVEGIAEISMPGVALSHLEMHAGGRLRELVDTARQHLAATAGDLGADGIVGLRYVVSGRDYEKSVLAFGTAVSLKKSEQRQPVS